MEKEQSAGSDGDVEVELTTSPVVTARSKEKVSQTPLASLLEKLGSRVQKESQDVFLIQLLETYASAISPRHAVIVVSTLKQFGVEANEDLALLTPAYLREYSESKHDISPMQVVITESFLRDTLELPSFWVSKETTPAVSFVQTEGPYKRVDPNKRRISRGGSLTQGDRSSIGSLTSNASTARTFKDRSTRRVHSNRRSNVL